jgi:hypothetical protein
MKSRRILARPVSQFPPIFACFRLLARSQACRLSRTPPPRSRTPPPRSAALLALGIASLLLTSLAARAVTDTWDGGGADDNIGTDANWVDNTAPVSNLLNTDLIFAGVTGLTPFFQSPFSTDSITFSNTAGAFVLDGATVFIGLTGIINNDAQTMTFENTVDFSNVPTSTINAASGGLTFTSFVELPTDTLTITGGDRPISSTCKAPAPS